MPWNCFSCLKKLNLNPEPLGGLKEGECVHGYLLKRGLEIFKEMLHLGVEVDSVTIISVLVGCAIFEYSSLGKVIHALAMKSCFEKRINFSNSLPDMYSKLATPGMAGPMEPSDCSNKWRRKHGRCRFCLLVDGCEGHYFLEYHDWMLLEDCLPNEALKTFAAMLEELKPDSRNYGMYSPACASLSALERGKEIHGHILRNGYSSYQHVANALVDLYGFGNEAITTSMRCEMQELSQMKSPFLYCMPAAVLDLRKTGNLSKACEFIETMPIAPDATSGDLCCVAAGFNMITIQLVITQINMIQAWNTDIESGIDPENELEAKDRFFNDIKSPNSVGITPFSPFEERFKYSRSSTRVREVGMFPLSLLSDKSTRDHIKASGVNGVNETVRSVRLTKRESQTPVRRRRERTQEKEVRESGAVGEVEGNEAVEGLGVVANSGVVKGGLNARVSCGGDVEGFGASIVWDLV
ncbi:hypothetical protein F3Y22_tig00111915pilonHSYRG00020 [Hibiscus syriacus]|uniref:Pentatricopeptide repeat-containing protein n=1 Tax=Hibiscus syriacus TaxID=106335 RepID=A0A6A2YF32_HIBSY|nr:hypothetical protein F3Y22_tig00111915pilonHSYRG00020 [Hibiscus syriacus]